MYLERPFYRGDVYNCPFLRRSFKRGLTVVWTTQMSCFVKIIWSYLYRVENNIKKNYLMLVIKVIVTTLHNYIV